MKKTFCFLISISLLSSFNTFADSENPQFPGKSNLNINAPKKHEAKKNNINLVQSSTFKFKSDTNIESNLFLDNDILYFSGKGYIYAINTIDGNIEWKSNKFQGNLTNVKDGIGYLIQENELVAIDLKNMNQIWQTNINNISIQSTINNNIIYLKNNENSEIYAYDIQNGNLLWSNFSYYNKFDLKNGKLYIAYGTGVVIIDSISGNTIEQFYLPSSCTSGSDIYHSQTRYIDGYIYAYDYNWTKLYRINESNHLCQSYTIGTDYYENQILNDNLVFVNPHMPSNVIQAQNIYSGKMLWQFTPSDNTDRITGSFKIVNNAIYTGTAMGYIYKINSNLGHYSWKFKVSEDKEDIVPLNTNIIEKNGILYFGSYNGYIYAIHANTGTL